MYVLGICNDETASACLFKNGTLLSAVSEERFSRIKQDNSFPIKSINFVLKNANIALKDIKYISYSWFKGIDSNLLLNYLNRYDELSNNSVSKRIFKERILWELERDRIKRKEFDNWVSKKIDLEKAKVFDFYHHEAHASSASLLSPFNEGVVLTSDARGDFESLTISKFNRKNKNPLKKIFSSTSIDSLGFFYGRITGLLGFKPMKHEGKITGLAAYGDPKVAIGLIKKMIDFKSGVIKANLGKYYKPFFNPYSKELKKEINSFKKQDIAAATQKHTEDCLVKLLTYHLKLHKIKKTNLMLAGGLFANVKINQVLKELKMIKDVYVQPQMSDGGLCLGAAALTNQKLNIETQYMSTAALGPRTEFQKIDENIYEKLVINRNIQKKICLDLKNSKVIGIIRGRMEFGPRALCNRSIIYKTSDVTINKWLNKRLSRTEFMPFAPVIREEIAKKKLLKFKSKDQTLKYMTSTINCTKEFQKKCPAVTHIDFTARPQVISKKENIFMWNLLKDWEKISGEFSLVNTSFNSHEEPIICNCEEALSALEKRIIDVLYIENIRIVKI